MIPSGVEALDSRLAGLRKGGTYAFLGPAAGGKSVLGLHFLIDGLERRESCVLVTRDEPAMLESRAMYLGYGPGRISEHPNLVIVRLPERLPTNLSLPPGQILARWLLDQVGTSAPARMVLESVDSLSEYSHTPRALYQDLMRFVERVGATTYVLIRAQRDGTFDREVYAPILDRATGAFRLQVTDRGERSFYFHTVPAGAFRSEPFSYTLRIGAGFTEELNLAAVDLPEEDRKRVIVVDEIGAISAEVIAGLEQSYDLLLLTSAAGALGQLSMGRYGALVLVVDPYDEARTFDLIFALRKEGNAAPIVLTAPSRGLRSTTRSRGLRVGGDDFFVADLPADEVVERIQMAWLRGSHRRSGLSQIGQIVQPVNGNGLARPMTDREFLQAMETLLAEQPPLFFCYVEFRVREIAPEMIWPALRTRVRLGDGDIIGLLERDRFGLALDRITPDQAVRVIERIRAGHPALADMTDVIVIASPMRADDIRELMRARGGKRRVADGQAAGLSAAVPGMPA